MTYRDLRNYIEHYLKELKSGDLKLLTERSVSRGGFGAMAGGSQRSRHQLHQVAAEVAPAEEEAPKRSWRESEPWVSEICLSLHLPKFGETSPRMGVEGFAPKRSLGRGLGHIGCVALTSTTCTTVHSRNVDLLCVVCVALRPTFMRTCPQRYFSAWDDSRSDQARRGSTSSSSGSTSFFKVSAEGGSKICCLHLKIAR